MIKNERQYRITKARVREFAEALDVLDTTAAAYVDVHPVILQAQRDAARNQHDDLLSQIQAYDALVEGRTPVLELASLRELPGALIKARISSGLTQRDLADRLGLKPQQIQRYEATDYAAANLERIQEVADALGVAVREEVLLPNVRHTLSDLWASVTDLGFPKALVLRRLIPRQLRDRVECVEAGASEPLDETAVVSQVAAFVARTVGLSASAVMRPRRPALDLAAVHSARFRASRSAHEDRLSAYTVYAHILALLTLEATRHLDTEAIPEDPLEVHSAITDRYGKVTFEAALRYAWSLGVPVLPLDDPAAFYGACWRIDGRNVIVLKQQAASHARWLFDLLHELRHAAEDPDRDELAVVEATPLSLERVGDLEEDQADDYAEEIIFGGRANDIAQSCVRRAGGRVDRLKRVVLEVSRKENVDEGALANYLAHRLDDENDIDWWGAAQNLQTDAPPACSVARDTLFTHVRLSGLNEFDRDLLLRALETRELEES